MFYENSTFQSKLILTVHNSIEKLSVRRRDNIYPILIIRASPW